MLPAMLFAGWLGSSPPAAGTGATAMVVSLDGAWRLATDAHNTGRAERWFDQPLAAAVPTRVPWIIQEAFPGYHGVAWYQREFTAPAQTLPDGRWLLRFWAVDYLAEVWLNGVALGGHEGGETPFVLDATTAIRPGAPNRLTVRVLNPTNEPIEGYVLGQTPGRNKVVPYRAGNSYDLGGILDSVELLLTPPVRIADLWLTPDLATGAVRARLTIDNATGAPARRRLALSLAPAAGGEGLTGAVETRDLPPGASQVEIDLRVAQPRPWDLSDPYLYRVTARLTDENGGAADETSARFGFRDFRFERGAFRLNGRRLFLKCSHTGNACPVGLQLPTDPDLLRRDLFNVKVMGFNAIRFIAGMPLRSQLDLCDELGLLVYEEHYGSWCLADSRQMTERYDRSLSEMIRRDRNHPSVAIWGLLNETPDGRLFRHVAGCLPRLRALDDSRLVLLNSGRWDRQAISSLGELSAMRRDDGPDPNVTHNGTDHALSGLGITWQPGQLALHPGPKGESSVLRWTAPAAGEVQVEAAFSSIAQHATTDVHLLLNGAPVFDGWINLHGQGPAATWRGRLTVAAGATLDAVVGWGNEDYGGDTTALALTLQTAGAKFDAAAQFGPDGPWRYGWLAPGPRPDSATFQPYAVFVKAGARNAIGSLSNPGSAVWEDVLDDTHPYQHVPHTADVINFLRTTGEPGRPLFISEYGVGSAVDLCRTVRGYERLGRTEVEDARYYRDKLDRFLDDWRRWRMDQCFARPEDFFLASQRQMSAERLYGLNAIRANPHVVGHSLTGTVDQGMSGEGLFTTFRELKPGAIDALFEAWAPLRLCLFAEPAQLYRGGQLRFEAVVANEDALAPGDYPVRLQVVGPGGASVFDRTVKLTIPPAGADQDRPFALPLFAETLTIDGPPGEYRCLGTFEQGAAAAGGEARFHLSDPAAWPVVEGPVELWGEDPELGRWLASHGLATEAAGGSAVILVGRHGSPDAGAWRALAAHVARGATVIFLDPEAFRRGDQRLGWLPLARRGELANLNGWLYHKDEWAKAHPIFDGLPAGGLLDHLYYREIITDQAFRGQDPPEEAVAGACDASFDYSSGLLLAVHRLGAGRVVLNTLAIRGGLGRNPVAERLLRNLLHWAGGLAPAGPPPADVEGLVRTLGYD
jgi:hypothetical protein